MPAQHQTQEVRADAAVGANLGFLVSASLDSSLCLWSSAGALVGVFGRHSWTLEDTSSWQSSARAPLKVRAGSSNGCGACADSGRAKSCAMHAYSSEGLLALPLILSLRSANVPEAGSIGGQSSFML
jgi:hypothetical protein